MCSIRDEVHITKGNCIMTDTIINVSSLSFGYAGSDVLVLEDITFDIKKGEVALIIGASGSGKTTLLKILNRVVSADSGTYTLGSNVKIGYYDQEHHVLHMEKTIFDEISDDYPTLTNTEIRNVLAAFLFTGDDVFKQISL